MTRLPTFPVEGGCACGAARYRLTAPPAFVYTCHCTDCQTLSTSAFTLNMPIRKETLELTQGELMTWTRTADSGNQSGQHVCATCGVRLYSTPFSRPDIYTLRAGTLDDTTWLRPVAAIWMKSALAWSVMPDDCLLFDEGFTDVAPLIEAYRAQTGSR